MKVGSVALLALCVGVACKATEKDPSLHHPASDVRVAAMAAPVCRVPRGGLRIAEDSIAGLAMRSSFRELRHVCRSALDSVSPGGYEALALRFDFPGAQVWAVSGADAYGEAIQEDSAPEFWWATGDSLRFASGVVIPKSVGALLALDSTAVLRADGGDDTEGSYIIPCRYPRMTLVLGYLSSLPDTGAWPLAARRVPDSLQFQRVTVDTGHHAVDPALALFCHAPPVT